ncbi:MAG: beta-galactosidase [Armatimonadetes bacterium]|nr:beta-galactosidase [Armatimonadota bacterium]
MARDRAGRWLQVMAVVAAATLALPDAAPGRGAWAQPAGQGASPAAASGDAAPLGLVLSSSVGAAQAAAAGASAVKIVADWSALEPRKGEFRWAALDDAVQAAGRAGLRVILVLAYTPVWASIATGLETRDPMIYSRQPPRQTADWEAFVHAAVTRYRDRVKDWQVWTILGLPWFRGTTVDYLSLLRGARSAARAADPQSRLIAATPAGVDLAFMRALLGVAGGAFEVLSIAPAGLAPEAVIGPLATFQERALAKAPGKRIWVEWDPASFEEFGRPAARPALLGRALASALAAGAERVFWAGPLDPATRLDVAHRTLAEALRGRSLAGHLRRGPGTYVLLFGQERPVVLAWLLAGSSLELSAEGDARVEVMTLGGVRTEVATNEGKLAIPLAIEPVVLAGLPAAAAAEARQTLGGRAWIQPPVDPRADFSRAERVWARLSAINEEHGLYNMPYRVRRNGALEVAEIQGAQVAKTNVARGIVYVYFNVDDTYLFFNDGRYAVELTIEVYGARAPGQLGFNIFYDSDTGYRFSPWQWVEAKDGWVTITITLPDANFANTWGWDFAINTAGNRREDLHVRAVSVRRIPRP